jgi:DnaJ family protein A protein 2
MFLSHFLLGWSIHGGMFSAGEVIHEKDKCPQCKGQKVMQDKKMLEVHIEKGMQNGQKITFQGEADEAV